MVGLLDVHVDVSGLKSRSDHWLDLSLLVSNSSEPRFANCHLVTPCQLDFSKLCNSFDFLLKAPLTFSFTFIV